MDGSPMVLVRRPHFRRHDPPPLRVTDDDIAIMRHVVKHRFLRSTHIVRLINRPAKKIVERLGALYHTGYLDRPRAQLDYYATVKRLPYVYGLGNRGAELLAEIDGTQTVKVDWTDKNREAGRPFIDHTLLVAEVMIAFEVAVRARPDVVLMEPGDVLANAPEATQRADNPWKWQATVSHDGGSVSVTHVPDKVFGLDFTAERKRVYFLLEADRATMPIARTNLRQTSIKSKLAAYYHGYRADEHRGRFGIGNFRVLTVTTSPQRLASMVEASMQVTGGAGSNLFLFADIACLIDTPDVLTFEWISGKGDKVSLAS
jgi:Replication-relaxation